VNGTIEAVRGMRDVLPDAQQHTADIRTTIEAAFNEYGYEQLDLPILEQRDLYQRKLGEELSGKIYEFSFGGRQLALRPEWTASVLRAYVAGMQEQPLPVRLAYTGPVFRYERPQRHTYRQFTQIGIELIGGPPPRGDAEVLALACTGLDRLGLTNYQVVLGHTGLARALLAGLGLPERTQSQLIWSMEHLRQHGVAVVRERLGAPHRTTPTNLELPPGLDDATAATFILNTLQAMRIELPTGTREPAEVVSRLMRKLRQPEPDVSLDRALTLLERLCRITGSAVDVIPAATALLVEAGADQGALSDLRNILHLLEHHMIPAERIRIDCGLGRGLQYYTGMLFEIYDPDGNQLCGGGRYDDLVGALGGSRNTPAVGLSYGLERIAAIVPPRNAAQPRRVLVIAVHDDDYAAALEVAGRLRQRGFIATIDVRRRTVANNLRDATRRAVNFVAIIGENERTSGMCIWRDLERHEEQRIPLDALDAL
jgi:histidyl-tRNA synthetase